MGKQYNWTKLKHKFIRGNYSTISDFARKQKIPLNTLYNHSKEWLIDRNTVQRQASEKTKERIIETTAEVNAKHLKEALLIRKWAHDNLFIVRKDGEGKDVISFRMEARTAREVIDAIRTSVDMERDVLGLNKNELNINVNDIKVKIEVFIEKLSDIIKSEVSNEATRNKIISRLVTLFSDKVEGEFDRRN